MPTKTFDHLNPTKQDAIFKALVTEFSHHQLATAQVARIIKDCAIARGSFYKYFADITDSYQYTLKRVLDVVHFDVFQRLQGESTNTLAAFYTATAEFVTQINRSPYRDFYCLHVAYNQYTLDEHPVDYHQIKPNRLVMIVDGVKIIDPELVAVVYKTATAASHNTIKAILMGCNAQTELADLKTLLQILQRGLLKGVE